MIQNMNEREEKNGNLISVSFVVVENINSRHHRRRHNRYRSSRNVIKNSFCFLTRKFKNQNERISVSSSRI